MTTKIPVELSSTPGIVDGSNATAITIDSSENISINSGDVTLATASKRYYVPRASDAAATGSLYSPADSDIRLSGAGSSAGELQFEPSSTSGVAMTITSAGNVGIGTTSPSVPLHVSGETYIDSYLSLRTTDDQANRWLLYTNTNDNLEINYNGSGNAEVVVDTSGNVGIGNTSMSSYDSNARNLVVGSGVGDEGMTIASGSGSAGRLYFADGTSSDGEKADGYILYNHASTYMAFGTNSGTERMRIDSSGRLLLGTTSVYSDSNDIFVASGGRSNFTASGISSGAFNRQTNTGDIIALLYNGGGKGSISTDGSNVAYNTSSDARLKNVLGEAKGLDIVSQLNPVNFEWKESGKIQDGLIAQEVEPLIPEAVSTNEHTGFYEMDYSKLVTPLVKAIQEQQEQIEQLKTEIQTLKGE
tara:strand:+ start:38 stop:1285 length:1248 start_codon:yes stop_codon:yes gene_type:complete